MPSYCIPTGSYPTSSFDMVGMILVYTYRIMNKKKRRYFFSSFKAEIGHFEKVRQCQLAFGLVLKVFFDELARTSSCDTVTWRQWSSHGTYPGPILRIYREIETAPDVVVQPT